MARRITRSMNLQTRVKAIISLGLFLILSASSDFSAGRWQGNPAHRDAGPIILSFGEFHAKVSVTWGDCVKWDLGLSPACR